jgi:hypothetical protein
MSTLKFRVVTVVTPCNPYPARVYGVTTICGGAGDAGDSDPACHHCHHLSPKGLCSAKPYPARIARRHHCHHPKTQGLCMIHQAGYLA